MRTRFASVHVLAFSLLCGLVLGGCSPQAKKARYLEQADRNFQSGKYDEAEINYKNILKIDGQNPQAFARLGLIYAEQGRIGQAVPFVLKARELQPDNLDLRLKIAQLNLLVGNPKDAQAEADYVLTHRPQDPEAPLVLAAATTKPKDVAALRSRFETLPAGAPVLTALGLMELRQGNAKAAEPLLRQALTLNPKFAAAHSGLGHLYLQQNDKTHAIESFRSGAENSPTRSPFRLQYAQFMIQTGDVAGGKRYLEEMTRSTPDYLTPGTMLAEVALMEKQYKASADYIEKILLRDPQNLEALFIRGRLQLAQGNTAKAIEELERLLKIYPRTPLAHYQLGLAYLAAGNATAAANSLRQTLSLMPGQTEATLALANLNLRTGDPSAALVLLKPLVQQQPKNSQARLLLAETHRMQKNFDEALKIYRQLEVDFPGNAQNALLTGLVHLQLNQPAEARQAFNQALARSPGLVPALERLATLDLVENKLDDALRRVETELVRNPSSAGAHTLLGKICIMKKDTARATAELLKAVELQPDNTEACMLLAQLYLQSHEDEKALANLQTVVGKNPRDVGAWMLTAQIYEQRKNYPAARDAYEKIIAVDPRIGSAYNNLACLYSDQLNEPEKALAAAQKARELMPQEPHVADTLAWIAFKKGQYRWALSLLEESASKLTDSPTIFFHLGMARCMLGQEEPARLAFQQAADLGKDFPELQENQQRLAMLSLTPDSATAENRALLEKILTAQPNDPTALTRLAAFEERDGARPKAIATLQKAAAANPANATPLIRLARLHALSKDTAKALEAARAARKIEPDDPTIAHTLGQIAYQSGDYGWAASLLSEATQKLPDDPALLHEAGLAYYAVGRVADAEANLQKALSLLEAKPIAIPLNAPDASQIRTLLEMIDLSQAPKPSAVGQIQQVLAADPNHVAALMASAALLEQQGDFAGARQACEKALARFPDFIPAKARIAVLAAAQPTFDAKAYELAQQARAALPNDPEIARALGILLFKKGGEPSRAVTLLKQAVPAKANDPELLYYLGLAQQQSKDTAGARQSLQKAIDSGLRPDLAAEARKVLSGPK
ncbi:MAG: tetratricopeptide repeat protein [Nibricoccus sp.]